MEFYSESNKPKTIATPCGSKFEPEYEEVINNKTGKTELKKTGETNVYDKIQESKESALLENIIKKYKIDINENNLTKIEETINDLTNLPDNLIDNLNIINQAKQTFEQSPQEVKQFFNNNFNEFLAGSENGTLNSLIKEIKTKNKIETKNEQINEQQQTQKIELTQEQIKKMIQEGIINE